MFTRMSTCGRGPWRGRRVHNSATQSKYGLSELEEVREVSARVKIVSLTGIEYLYLVLLWMAFVSKAEMREFEVGLGVALIAAVADAIVKSEGFGSFRPKLREVLLTFLEPWYVAKGTWDVVRGFTGALRSGQGRFKAVQFDTGDKNVESATHRALATMLLTIPPNSVVVGIDGHNGKMLIHEMKPEAPSLLSRKLGVQE